MLEADAVAVFRSRWRQWLVTTGGQPFAVDVRGESADAAAAALAPLADGSELRVFGPLARIGGREGEAEALSLLGEQAAALDESATDRHLEAMAELAAGAGHEVNNPLATIAGRVDRLRRDETDADRLTALNAILTQTFRARDMIGDLMLFARPPQPQREPVDFSETVGEVLAEFADDVAARRLSISGLREDAVVIQADATQTAIVVSELLRNAIDFAPCETAVRVDLSRRGTDAVLSVADEGPGLTDVERRHLFDPFFSGRQSGRGLGFGLPKCWRIVHAHGGGVRLADEEPTRFEVCLPLTEEPPRENAGS